MGQMEKPFNFLEGYFNIPESMINALKDDLQRTKSDGIQKQNSHLYILTPYLAHHTKPLMSKGVSNKDGRIFFITLVSRTLPDKKAHKHIICEYILKLEITQSNTMEAFQRELSRHIKKYDASQRTEWKKITNHVIKKYRNIDEPAFQTGFNTIILAGHKQQTTYAWLDALLMWTNDTHHDLISRNLWYWPEVANNHELNTMLMDQNSGGHNSTIIIRMDVLIGQRHTNGDLNNSNIG
jgi:hypothetical protein